MRKVILVLVLVFFNQNINAQSPYADYDLIESYSDYAEMDRELVYTHINKSTFIKGESIGLQAYFFDKTTKELSTETSNAYFTISDAKGKIINSKLVMTNNGIAISDFEINDSFTSGNYIVKVYTNWMRNFEEQNFFTETVKILDPKVDNKEDSNVVETDLDAQFLGESGHVLAAVDNTVGVIIKNKLGFGVPFIEGKIVDASNITVSTFKVNQLGIGKFIFKPEANKTYKAIFNYENKDYNIAIDNIKNLGIVLSLQDANGKLVLNLKTNLKTLPNISKQVYKLAIHNGTELKETFFAFKGKKDLRVELPKKDLYSGINILTVFDKDNTPILERQYFNYNGLNFLNSETVKTESRNDSTLIKIPYQGIKVNDLNRFSVSVLPSKTVSNSRHHNIASYVLLQPYVKGYVEQAHYYFSNISNQKKYDLDNLLITQGWSSYDWEAIFENPPEYDFDSEIGVSYTAAALTENNARLILYPILNSPLEFARLDSQNRSFVKSELFPVNDEQIQIGEITATGQILKPKLKLSFSPSKIPGIQSVIKPLDVGFLSVTEDLSNNIITWKRVEDLEEVFIEKKKAYTKLEKLQNRSLGKVEAIDETTSTKYQTLVRYLRDKGFTVNDSPGKFIITNNSVNHHRDNSVRTIDDNNNGVSSVVQSGGKHSSLSRLDEHSTYEQNSSSIPLVYFNGMLLHQNLEVLANLRMNQIEYIEINKAGIGGGMRAGTAGLIRIKTKVDYLVEEEIVEKEDVYIKYDIPLKFSVTKSFYIPNYVSKQNDFFNKYGTISWHTNLTIDSKGNLNIKIPSSELKDIKLFIEGATNNKTFISEIKDIKIN
ncbi:hypothetical protein [uncultured Lacinutrix sp.]|uniref:hypothetical protein n=1 Tax=uncultured Lacinutrix sp. TaxID=574032 RepID=UPI002612E044|nr:hypothetical protein [uncultured Lacinutrix sp.]